MRPIGGELEVNSISNTILFTDSGRSSLRLFIRSGHKDKKFLLPNYFCEIIEKVLIEEKIEYEFYNIKDDLKIDIKSITSKEYDVLYIINYFGMQQKLEDVNIEKKIIIEDNVFFSDFFNYNNYKLWYGFNSFRKVTNLSDGSMIKTNLYIDKSYILNQEAPFVKEKEIAKILKYDYIHNSKNDEQIYINRFEEAENLINTQHSIYMMSNKSLYRLGYGRLANDKIVLKQRYDKLKNMFIILSVELNNTDYSFFVLKMKNRELFKRKMISKSVYLPIHWPRSSQDNILYDELISIPLFSNYTDKEFDYLVNIIKKSLDGKYK
jgi:hypothetical protein